MPPQNALNYPLVGCRVFHNTAQSILTGNAASTLSFNSERWDTNGIHDNSTNNSRLTCRTAGDYLIGVNVTFASNNTGSRLVRIRLNAATVLAQIVQPAAPDLSTVLQLTAYYPLAVNDYVEAEVAQTSGVSLNINANPNYSPEFWMFSVS